MAGKTLAEQGIGEEIVPPYYSVKEAVFPFNKFPGVDPLLGPEMKVHWRSDGRRHHLWRGLHEKSQLAAGHAPADGGHGVPERARCRQGQGVEIARTYPAWALAWSQPAARRRCWKNTRSRCAWCTR